MLVIHKFRNIREVLMESCTEVFFSNKLNNMMTKSYLKSQISEVKSLGKASQVIKAKIVNTQVSSRITSRAFFYYCVWRRISSVRFPVI